MPPNIFITGSANIDLTFRMDGMPKLGVTEVCSHYQMGFGGKGANQAVSAARLGANVTFLAKVGADAFGPAIQEQLRKEGIRTDHVTIAPDLPTGTAVILVNRSGENSIITHAGPNVTVTAADVLKARADVEAAKVVLATLETPGPALLELFRRARLAGIATILNPAPPVRFPLELLKLVDICIPNESELHELTGIGTHSLEAVAQGIEVLESKGPKTIVVTLGERGVMVKQAGTIRHIPAISVKAIDTSGAGDSFCGSFAVYWAEGMPLIPAIEKANRTAAISVTRPGTQTSFPLRHEIE
jgi:ribokinase